MVSSTTTLISGIESGYNYNPIAFYFEWKLTGNDQLQLFVSIQFCIDFHFIMTFKQTRKNITDIYEFVFSQNTE